MCRGETATLLDHRLALRPTRQGTLMSGPTHGGGDQGSVQARAPICRIGGLPFPGLPTHPHLRTTTPLRGGLDALRFVDLFMNFCVQEEDTFVKTPYTEADSGMEHVGRQHWDTGLRCSSRKPGHLCGGRDDFQVAASRTGIDLW